MPLTPLPVTTPGSANATFEATWASITAAPTWAGHNSQLRCRSFPLRCPGRSNHAVTAPATHHGIATRSMTNRAGWSRTEMPGGSSAAPPSPQ